MNALDRFSLKNKVIVLTGGTGLYGRGLTADLAAAALGCVRPLGVLVVLGARNAAAQLPFLDLIVGNRTITGSVNAGPEHFRQAIATLAALEPAWLRPMIERRPLHRALESLAAAPGDAIKVVHALH